MPALIGLAAKAAVMGSVALSPAHAHTVVVKPGDTLSALATDSHVPGGWQSIFAANRAKINNPDLIFPDEKLTMPDHAMRAVVTTSAVTSSSPAHAARDKDQASCTPNCPFGDGDGDSMDMDHSPFHSAPVSSQSTASVESTSSAPVHRHSNTVASGTFHGSGSMQQCIISRESGGNSQVMNASGHYGLYQFSESTWVASGGSAATFGNASVSEQNQVFANAVAARGYSDWTPYDGC